MPTINSDVCCNFNYADMIPIQNIPDSYVDLNKIAFTVPVPTVTCPCVFTALPMLGAGNAHRYVQEAKLNQGVMLESVPTPVVQNITQSTICECKEEN
jgi:hypothetical protein